VKLPTLSEPSHPAANIHSTVNMASYYLPFQDRLYVQPPLQLRPFNAQLPFSYIPGALNPTYRVGTIADGRCSCAAILLCVNGISSHPDNELIDLYRSLLHTKLNEWQTETWLLTVPAKHRLTSLQQRTQQRDGPMIPCSLY
jgi:hypothetical protein